MPRFREAPSEEIIARAAQRGTGLRFDSGHAAGARDGDGLPVGTVLQIAGVQDTGDVGARAAFGNDVAVVQRAIRDKRPYML